MVLYSDLEFYEYAGISNETILKIVYHVIKKPFIHALKDIYNLNPNINSDFFCFEGNSDDFLFHEEKRSNITESFFIDGYCRYDSAWILTLPPQLNAQTLAGIIKKKFIGIGGIVHLNKIADVQLNCKTIFFMKEDFEFHHNYDYSHVVSHEIDHEKLKEYFYHPQTIGEYFRQFKNSEDFCNWINYEKISNICLSEETFRHLNNKSDDPRWIEKFEELMEKECERNDPFPLYTSNEGIIEFCKLILKNLILRKELSGTKNLKPKIILMI